MADRRLFLDIRGMDQLFHDHAGPQPCMAGQHLKNAGEEMRARRQIADGDQIGLRAAIFKRLSIHKYYWMQINLFGK
jgi:hypothetical protein